VPLLFYGPPWILPGRIDTRVEISDVAPTLARILRIPPPASTEARSCHRRCCAGEAGRNSRALPLGPIDAWFESNGWNAFPFQREVWQAYLEVESGLHPSATGSGKTLAAWLGPLAQWMGEEGAGRTAPALRVLWITPMRALASDTVYSMQRAVDGMALPWTVGLRTGDTSSAERARQARKLPSALVTTPESLALMLSNAQAREKLSQTAARGRGRMA